MKHRVLRKIRLAGSAALLLLPFALPAAEQAPAAHRALGRELLRELIDIDTTPDHGSTTTAAEAMAKRFLGAGFDPADVLVLGDNPLKRNLVVRLRGRGERQPILLLAHLDVVEAKRADWKQDPFEFSERDGYFYGRGSYDNKAGMVGLVTSLLKLKEAGWKPKRDLILFFTGDEETGGRGARLGATEWRSLIDSEYALNSDGGGGAFLANGSSLGFGLQTAEKTFQTFHFTVRNKGGHSSRPSPNFD